MLIGILLALLVIVLLLWWYLNTPVFGKLPSGKRLERIQGSPNYKNGAFQNLSPTPQMAEGHNFGKVLWNFLFKKPKNVKPSAAIPVIHTDLHALDIQKDQLIWLGHSSYLFTVNGKTYLVDPVLSNNASPLPKSNTAFKHSYQYTPKDIPAVDFLIITHDHFDHLDYKTVVQLQSKVKHVICGLGVGEHLEYWGYDPAVISELDWYEVTHFEHNINIAATPSRHFSGRTLMRNTSLFCSYVLQSGDKTIFIGGDSGYDQHFKLIGDLYGPFDLAILENGQYNEAWRYIHTLPEEFPQVIKDINAKAVLPVHCGKFALAMHDWSEPLERLRDIHIPNVKILTPQIGQIININDTEQIYKSWW